MKLDVFKSRMNDLDEHFENIMSWDDISKAIHKIIRKNKPKTIKILGIEECSELQKAITKDIRFNTRSTEIKLGILEELADVYIMLGQLKEIYEWSDEELRMAITVKANHRLNLPDIMEEI